MNKYRFSNWLLLQEDYAKFGLEPKRPTPEDIIEKDKLVKPINLEYVLDDLKRQKLGVKTADGERFFGEITWGDQPGATRLYFSPFRGLRAVLRRLSTDLKGESVWICKKVVEVRNLFDEHPDTLIVELHNALKEVDAKQIDFPQQTSDFDMEKFVLHLAYKLRRDTTERTLMYEGIRRVVDGKEYIIHWGCTGMGRQVKDQRRLDQFQVQVEYNKDRGTIHIVGNELGSKIKDYKWELSPSQFDEYFFPSQEEEEIVKCVLHSLNSY